MVSSLFSSTFFSITCGFFLEVLLQHGEGNSAEEESNGEEVITVEESDVVGIDEVLGSLRRAF